MGDRSISSSLTNHLKNCCSPLCLFDAVEAERVRDLAVWRRRPVADALEAQSIRAPRRPRCIDRVRSSYRVVWVPMPSPDGVGRGAAALDRRAGHRGRAAPVGSGGACEREVAGSAMMITILTVV